MRSAYVINLIKNGGKSQTIAIVDAYDDPNIDKDLGTFSGNSSCLPDLPRHYVGTTGTCGANCIAKTGYDFVTGAGSPSSGFPWA
jgi:hypothetical protein